MNRRKIGVLGGTFDPIHDGHLVLGEYIRGEMGLDKIIFIPAGIPPHKMDSDVTANEHRLAMVKLATSNNSAFEVSDMEIKTPEISYTLYTLQMIRDKIGQDYELSFITGADAMWDVETWKDSEILLREFPFIVGTRPGFLNKELNEKVIYLNKKYGSKIECVTVPGLDISSSEIRQRIKLGKSIKYLVPEAVEKYIFKEGLYR